MSWSRAETTALIEEYRKWPNLYKITSANYKNRNLRRSALEAIVMSLKDIKPDLTTSEVQNKFQALKQTAVKEMKKCKSSNKSGAGTDEVCIQ